MKTKDITLTAILLAILIVCSQIIIPLAPLPFTLQTFAVALIAMIVKPKHAFLTTLLYLLIGLIGLPIFAGGLGGLQAILSPSFGFIISFIPASFIQSYYLKTTSSFGFKGLIISSILNFLITYMVGLTYMAVILNTYLGNAMNFPQILMAGLIPFIPGDLIKYISAVVLAKRLRPQLKIVSQ